MLDSQPEVTVVFVPEGHAKSENSRDPQSALWWRPLPAMPSKLSSQWAASHTSQNKRQLLACPCSFLSGSLVTLHQGPPSYTLPRDTSQGLKREALSPWAVLRCPKVIRVSTCHQLHCVLTSDKEMELSTSPVGSKVVEDGIWQTPKQRAQFLT